MAFLGNESSLVVCGSAIGPLFVGERRDGGISCVCVRPGDERCTRTGKIGFEDDEKICETRQICIRLASGQFCQMFPRCHRRRGKGETSCGAPKDRTLWFWLVIA